MPGESIDRQAVDRVLQEFTDPESGRSVLEMEQVREVNLGDEHLAVTLGLTSFAAPLWEEIRAELATRLAESFPQRRDKITVEIETLKRKPEKIGEIGLTAKAVIAVGSGKGGVGKSTIAASLALGLKNKGCQVGLLDADVYGPSIPHLLGVQQRPEARERRLMPVMADGLRVMSMGFLVPPGEAVVWRGPMLHGAITQFLRDTEWGDLDYLIIDMPPGTGDIALTLSQLLPLTGAVVVCTPQDVALLDAVKAIAMFRKVNIPVLGLIENMSYFECPDTGKRYDIFGHGGAKQRAQQLEIPFLGEVPINISIRVRGDEGTTAGNFADQEVSTYFEAITRNLVRDLVASRRAQPPKPSLPVL